MSLASRAARGSAVTLASQAVKVLIMLASTIVLARLLSPNDYGLVAMVTAIVGIADIFRDFGLSMAALQAKNLTTAQQSNLFWINTAVGAGLTVLVFLLSWPIALFYGQPDLVLIVQAISPVYLLSGMSTQFKVSINRDLRFVALALADLIPYAAGFTGALVLALLAPSFWSLVAQQLIIAGMTLILAVLLSRWKPGLPRRRADMGGLLKFGFSFAGTQLISYVTRNVDSIAVGRVWGSVQLGFYDRAYQLLLLPLNQINTPLSRVAIPVLSRITEERDRYLSFLRQAQLIAAYVTSSIFLILAAVAPELVALVLGEQWREAGLILSILAIGGVFRSTVQISYWMYMSQGMAGQQLRFYLVSQPAIVVCMLAGLPWGPLGVAVGHSVGYAANWLASLMWAGRVSQLDVRPLIGDALRALFTFGLPAAAASYGVLNFAPIGDDVLRLGVALVAGCAWLVLSYVLFARVRKDIAVLLRFVRAALGGRS